MDVDVDVDDVKEGAMRRFLNERLCSIWDTHMQNIMDKSPQKSLG